MYSGRKPHFCFLVVETSGNQCVRRHIGLEVGVRARRAVWDLFQVGCASSVFCPIFVEQLQLTRHPRSSTFGNERFKPLHGKRSPEKKKPLLLGRQELTAVDVIVVRSPEESATQQEGPFDYVILCIKALPDVYDLASVIEPVVTPQHTCILINTTNALGIESAIEERFPTNVVLSLVSNAELSQLGQSEFEHKGSTEVWVGPANGNDNIPASIQEDMAQALAMTLSTGQVDCKVSSNIRQQQYERMIG